MPLRSAHNMRVRLYGPSCRVVALPLVVRVVREPPATPEPERRTDVPTPVAERQPARS